MGVGWKETVVRLLYVWEILYLKVDNENLTTNIVNPGARAK